MTEIPIPQPISQPDNPDFLSGHVAIVGRPNVGKSTLLNALVGEKVAITTPIAQTTRHMLRGIVTTADSQIVFVDTPGIHKPRSALGRRLNTTAADSTVGVDVILFMVDGKNGVGKGDQWVYDNVVKPFKGPAIAIINKTDAFSAPKQLPTIAQVAELGSFEEIIPISAIKALQGKQHDLNVILGAINKYLPTGPMLYPHDEYTDQSVQKMVSEIIREKAMQGMKDEVPHSIAVMVDQMGPGKKSDVTLIYATILVERDSQKGILIGKQGKNLSYIGKHAREELEPFLQKRVYLDLRVKLFSQWQQDERKLTELGY